MRDKRKHRVLCYLAGAGLLLGVACDRGEIVQTADTARPPDTARPTSGADDLVFIHPSVRQLDEPALYAFPEAETDPLEDVADIIRPQIDPASSPKWPDRFKPDYVEHITSIRPDYEKFWQRIPAEARRYVDLFNDGTPEYVVMSNGLNEHYWGFRHFLAVFHRPPDEWGVPATKWELLHLQVFEEGLSEESDAASGTLRLRGFDMVVSDLDRNGRSNVLITTLQTGVSAHTFSVHVLGIGSDLRLVHHTLQSAAPIEVLGTDEIRPAFVRHVGDQPRGGEPSVGTSARGHRKMYYRWTVDDGFQPF